MKKYLSLFLLIFSVSFAQAAAKSDVISIKPVVTVFDSIPQLPDGTKLYLGTFSDTTPSRESGSIGTTRTGIKKTAPIIVKPSLAETFRVSFQTLLEKRGNLSTDASMATYVVDITIIHCTLTEHSSGVSQTLTADMKVEVTIAHPLEADKARTFTVESQNSTRSLDTSKFAESTLRDTYVSILCEIVKAISKVQ